MVVGLAEVEKLLHSERVGLFGVFGKVESLERDFVVGFDFGLYL